MIDNPILIASRVATYGNVKRAKVSAIAFTKSGRVLAVSHNRRIEGSTHRNKWTQHAEEYLLYKLNRIKAFQRFGNITILVLRVNHFGLAMAKPCEKCRDILSHYIDCYGVKILYSDINGKITELGGV